MTNFLSIQFDLMAYVGKHGEEVVHPRLDPIYEELKNKGFKTIAAVGYCFGVSLQFHL
jgi:hypothetical protein